MLGQIMWINVAQDNDKSGLKSGFVWMCMLYHVVTAVVGKDGDGYIDGVYFHCGHCGFPNRGSVHLSRFTSIHQHWQLKSPAGKSSKGRGMVVGRWSNWERRWSDVSLGVRMKRSLGKTSYVFSYVFLMKHMFPFTSFVSRRVCLSPPSTQVIPSIELCRLRRPTHGVALEVFLDHGTDEGTIFAGLMYAAYPWYKATGELYICHACARNIQSCLALCGHEL